MTMILEPLPLADSLALGALVLAYLVSGWLMLVLSAGLVFAAWRIEGR